MLPRVEPFKLAPRLAAASRSATTGATPIATFGFDEPSLNYYCDRSLIERIASDAALDMWAAERRDGVVVIPRTLQAAFAKRGGGRHLAELASVDGFNDSKGKSMELVALRRTTAPR